MRRLEENGQIRIMSIHTGLDSVIYLQTGRTAFDVATANGMVEVAALLQASVLM